VLEEEENCRILLRSRDLARPGNRSGDGATGFGVVAVEKDGSIRCSSGDPSVGRQEFPVRLWKIFLISAVKSNPHPSSWASNGPFRENVRSAMMLGQARG
jgi:Holliday junction resolvasome RuvABC endonuclease subunit